MSLLAAPIFSPDFSKRTGAAVSVTPGASNAEGAWTQLFTALADDVYGIWFWIYGGNTSAQIRNHLLDIGTDPAGGTTYVQRVADLQCGNSFSVNAGGIWFYAPYYIPSGSTVAVRIQGSNGAPGTVTVSTMAYSLPRNPEVTPILKFSETVGTITTSRGVVVTPGTSSGEGAWTSIGTTTQRWLYVLPLFQIEDATTNAQVVRMDVSYGDATNKRIVVEDIHYYFPSAAEATIGGPGLKIHDLWHEVPSGTTIYARLSTTLATADSNYSVLVTGFG